MVITLPIGTHRRARCIPFVTYGLIATNVLIHVLLYVTNSVVRVTSTYGFIPGQLNAISWFTYMFLHGGWLHLTGNMLYLWLFGPALECAMGWWLYLPTYLLSGCCAMMLHYLIVHTVDGTVANVPLVGASGAIAGLLGLYTLRFYQTKVRVWYIAFLGVLRCGTFAVPSMWFLGFWIAQQIFWAIYFSFFANSAFSGVAHWTHIGGFALGMLYALLVNLQGEGKTEYQMEEACTAFTAGSYARVMELADCLLKREPGNVEVRLLKARSASQREMTETALREFERALRQCLRLSQVERARAIHREMLTINPDLTLEPGLELYLASMLTQHRHFEEAMDGYRRIIRSIPRCSEAETAYMRSAQLLLDRLDLPQQAAQLLEYFVREYPASHWLDFAKRLLEQAHKRLRTGPADAKPPSAFIHPAPAVVVLPLRSGVRSSLTH